MNHAFLRPLLIAEDHPRDQELIRHALAKCRVANPVTMVGDGVEALDYVYRRGRFSNEPMLDPAVMLLDLKMPQLDGLQVTLQIKGDPARWHIPIVMLTGSREESDIAESYRLGANGYVVKPVGFKDCVQAIECLANFWTVLNSLPLASGEPLV